MKTKCILAMAASALLALSCQKDRELPVFSTDSKAIRIDPQIASAFVKSNPLDDNGAMKFNVSDRIGLVCEDGHVTFELGENGWLPTDNYYLRWGNEPVTYTAFYPATDPMTGAAHFDLPVSQRSLEKMAAADYMLCTVENATRTADGVLPLKMERKMARVSFVLGGIEEGSKVQGFRVYSSAGYDDGKINTSKIYVNPYVSTPEGITAGQNGTVYTAIVTPSEGEDGEKFISMNYQGNDITLTGIPEIRQGYSYEYPLDIQGRFVTIGTPSVEPWTDGTEILGEASKVEMQPYFVAPDADGSGDGLTWETAYSLSQFLSAVENDGSNDEKAFSLNDRPFYFAAGEYKMPRTIKIEYSGYVSPVRILIYGGYEKMSGTYLVKSASRTTLLYPDGQNLNWFTIGNQANPVFNGFEFRGDHGANANPGTVFYAWAGGSGDAVLDLEDCIFINGYAATNNGDNNPSAIKIGKALARLNRVVFDNCRSNGGIRGGEIRMMSGAAARLYMNSCRVYNSAAGGGGWGIVLQAHGAENIICAHNTTISNCDNGCGAMAHLNGAGAFCIASSTIVSRNNTESAALRCDSSSDSHYQVLVNSILVNERNGNSLEIANNTAPHSFGGNIFVGTIKDNNGKFTKAGSDIQYSTLSDAQNTLGLQTVQEDYSVQWNGSFEGKLKMDAIANAIRQFKNGNCGKVANGYKGYDGNLAGEDFAAWLESIDAFATDCYGNPRDPDAVWPGSYEKH